MVAYKFNDDILAEALRETRGNYSAAARFVSEKWNDTCTRHYIKTRTEASPYLTAIRHEVVESIVDRAEDNIFTLVNEGDYAASVLVVRTLGKERGWIPKEEVDAKVSGEAIVAAIKAGRERAGKDTPHSDAPPADAPDFPGVSE